MRPRLFRERRAVASIEFALVAPVLITLGLGMVETVRYVRTRALLGNAVTAMADLVAGQASVTTASLGDLCTGARYVMLPFTTTSLAMSVNSYTYPNGTGTVARDWQYNSGCPSAASAPGASLGTGAATMVPNRGDSVIAVVASYTYISVVSTIFPSVTFSQTAYARPRYGSVICTGC